jgi:hypothetical protein
MIQLYDGERQKEQVRRKKESSIGVVELLPLCARDEVGTVPKSANYHQYTSPCRFAVSVFLCMCVRESIRPAMSCPKFSRFPC